MGEKLRAITNQDLKDIDNIKEYYRNRNQKVHFDNEKVWEWQKGHRRMMYKMEYQKKWKKFKEKEEKKEKKAKERLEKDISEYNRLYRQAKSNIYTRIPSS